MQHVAIGAQTTRTPIAMTLPEMSIGETVMDLLGGRALLRDGIKAGGFSYDRAGLSFNISGVSPGGKRVTRVVIAQRADDTYTLCSTCWRPKTLDFQLIDIASGLLGHELSGAFTHYTGLSLDF